MTPFEGACYGAGLYLFVRGAATLLKRGQGPEGWKIRVYPLTLLIWASLGALVPITMELYK